MSENKVYGFDGNLEDTESMMNIIRKREVETVPSSYFMCNLSDVIKKYRDWIAKFPRVKPFYAVRN